MPLIYRSMRRDGVRPMIGASKTKLGVKAGTDEYADIVPDSTGGVGPGTGGMSVAPAWRDLPAHRIARRLRPLCSKAVGGNHTEVWYMGDGVFADGSVTVDLSLRVDRPNHGTVEPADTMSVASYQQALADTANQWLIDPETESTQ